MGEKFWSLTSKNCLVVKKSLHSRPAFVLVASESAVGAHFAPSFLKIRLFF